MAKTLGYLFSIAKSRGFITIINEIREIDILSGTPHFGMSRVNMEIRGFSVITSKSL